MTDRQQRQPDLPPSLPEDEYDLVDDIEFDPPLTPEEQRRIYGLGMTMEERLERAIREHGLVGDVVFEPPLTPEERRRRGVDVSVEEALERMRRRRAEESDR